MKRRKYSSGTQWESKFSYARAVRVGNVIEVAGTTAVDETGAIMGNNAQQQTEYIFKKIEHALQQLDAQLTDVVRTRMYIVNADDSEAVGLVHGKVFKGINPAATMLVVNQLIDKQLLVEIEVTAMLV